MSAFPCRNLIRFRVVPVVLAVFMLLGLWAAVAAHAPDDTPGEPGRALRSGMANVAAGAVSAAVGVANPGFHATRAADGYAVANQAQEFAATLDQNGFLVSAGATSWGLRLTAIGRGNDLAAAGAATLHAAGNRVEVRRNALTEWYVNGPLGLEHGFTLAMPPTSVATGEPVVLALRQQGAPSASVTDGGRSLRIAPAGGSVLHYAGLVAYDARGVELPASMSVDAAGTVRIEVDDGGAHYPLTIDPLIQHTKLTAPSPVADDFMGVGR